MKLDENDAGAIQLFIQYRNLNTYYTGSLFYRFIDGDIKSDGTKAAIGVTWNMSGKDKKDLLFKKPVSPA